MGFFYQIVIGKGLCCLWNIADQLWKRSTCHKVGKQDGTASVKHGKASFGRFHIMIYLPVAAKPTSFSFISAKVDHILQWITKEDTDLVRETI